jgi:DNA-binding transcriptional MerR regulator
LDGVTAEDVTELLDSRGQQLSNEGLEELHKELSQQKDEQKEKDNSPLKSMKTSDIQRILSATETLTYEVCEIDHVSERSAKVKRRVVVSMGPYSVIPK